MAKITSFNRETCTQFRVALNEALAKVEADLGLKIDIAGITFYGDALKTELSAVVASEELQDPIFDGVTSAWIRDLKRYLGDKALKKEITVLGQKAYLVGMKGKGTIIFKWVPGTLAAKKQPSVRSIKFSYGDEIFKQLTAL